MFVVPCDLPVPLPLPVPWHWHLIWHLHSSVCASVDEKTTTLPTTMTSIPMLTPVQCKEGGWTEEAQHEEMPRPKTDEEAATATATTADQQDEGSPPRPTTVEQARSTPDGWCRGNDGATSRPRPRSMPSTPATASVTAIATSTSTVFSTSTMPTISDVCRHHGGDDPAPAPAPDLGLGLGLGPRRMMSTTMTMTTQTIPSLSSRVIPLATRSAPATATPSLPPSLAASGRTALCI